MAFYTTANFSGINENYLEDIQVGESTHDPGIKGAMDIMIENEQNFSAIMKAVGFDELSYFEETGTIMVYENSTVKSLFTRLKEFFEKAYIKIKELFKSFIAILDRWIKNDADFVNKYRTHLMQVDTKGFEYKGYIFTIDKFNMGRAAKDTISYINSLGLQSNGVGPYVDSSKINSQIESVQKWNSKKDDHIEILRGKVAGVNNKLTAKEYHEKLFAKLRNNENKPGIVTSVDIYKLLETISTFKQAKKNAEDYFKELTKAINSVINDLNNQEKDIIKTLGDTDRAKAEGRSAAIKYAATLASAQKDRLNILQVAQGALMSAMKQENRQAKAVCSKLVRYKPKTKSIGEGARNSLLDGLVLK